MQDVESPERGKDNPSAYGLLMAQVILQPELFEAEFRAGIPSSGLPEPRPTGFAGDVSLQFQLQQTLEFQLTVELQPVADARVGRQHESSKRKRLGCPAGNEVAAADVIGFETE